MFCILGSSIVSMLNFLNLIFVLWLYGLSKWLSGTESSCQCRRCEFDPWVGKIPLEKEMPPTPVFSLEPGKDMDRGTWQATVHGVPKSQTGRSNWAHIRNQQWLKANKPCVIQVQKDSVPGLISSAWIYQQLLCSVLLLFSSILSILDISKMEKKSYHKCTEMYPTHSKINSKLCERR